MEIAMSMNIGFWGVGLMGAPLARRLIKAGYNVLAYSRNLAKAREVADAGRTGSATDRVEDLAACDVLFTCLALPEHVRRAVSGPTGLYGRMNRGAVHVECSTIDPALAESLAEEAARRGIAYVQATLGKTPLAAAGGEAPIFTGGDAAARKRVWPLLEVMGKPEDVSSINAACAIKLISNLVGMANLAVLAEGMRLGQRAGIAPELLLRLLADTGARGFQMETRGPWIANKDFAPRCALSLAHKDMRLGCEMARHQRVSTPVLEAARAVFAAAEAQGLGKLDCAAVSEVSPQTEEASARS